MNAVSGSLISSQLTSLSKAARTLSTFLSTEAVASQALSAYLKRASASFDELFNLHHNLKFPKPDRTNHDKIPSRTEEIDGNLTDEVIHIKDRSSSRGLRSIINLDDERWGFDHERQSGRKKKTREVLNGRGIDGIEDYYEDDKKKRNKTCMEDGSDDGNEKLNRRKKKKKRRR